MTSWPLGYRIRSPLGLYVHLPETGKDKKSGSWGGQATEPATEWLNGIMHETYGREAGRQCQENVGWSADRKKLVGRLVGPSGFPWSRWPTPTQGSPSAWPGPTRLEGNVRWGTFSFPRFPILLLPLLIIFFLLPLLPLPPLPLMT